MQDPNYARAFAGMSDSYLLLWSYGFVPPAEAIPKVKAMPGTTGNLYAVWGRRAEAQKALTEMKRLDAARGYVNAGDLMWMHINLGEKDQTFAWMEKAYSERSVTLTAIKVNPGFDSLRSDPRFQDLRRRMNLLP